jgi:ArsR family transcriptional regulator, virulence genes transcriptional regulator
MKVQHDLELYKLKAEISKTFSDPKRLILITELRDGEKTVGELVESCGFPQAIVSHQLAILRNSGVVKPRREGNRVFYSLSDMRICQACDIVHEVLMDQLQSNRDLAKRFLK